MIRKRPGSASRSDDDRAASDLPCLDQLWLALDVEIQDFLDGVTIADLVAGELPTWAAERVQRAATTPPGPPSGGHPHGSPAENEPG